MTPRLRARRYGPLSLAIVLLLIAGGVYLWSRQPGTSLPNEGAIRVVAGPGMKTAPTLPMRPASPSAVATTPPSPSTAQVQTLQADALRAFPMLYAVRIECDATCTLVATLGPNATTGDWPRSQWPYDGNLERFLSARGYAPLGSLVIDQPGDNDTLLRVPIVVPRDRD